VDEFGKLPVDQITAQQIYTWLNRLAAKDYSQKVISNSRSVAKQVLDEAFIAGDIQVNPCIAVPAVKGKPKVKRKPTPEEDIKKIEKTKTLNNFARMSYFMLFTGCRRGEAAALQQKHINREKKMATICQSVAYRKTRKPVLKSPKTDASSREVDLYDNVLEILPEYDDPETYVFFPEGLPTKTDLESGLKKYQTENGLTSTAHQLRHAYATMGHAAKIDPKDMQHRLGHSSIAMTMDIYTDLDNKYNSEVRNQFNDYIQKEVIKK
jgi:integrase